jgi:hypothetical protein
MEKESTDKPKGILASFPEYDNRIGTEILQ